MTEIDRLCAVPNSKRDSQWESKFLTTFPKAELFIRNESPFQGPDGFSYMDISTEEGTKLNLDDFFDWCTQAGVGIVVNLKKNQTPDYVFNYGMIWNYMLRGVFLNEDRDYKPETPSPSDDVYVHKVMEGYLPQYVRENIKDFLMVNGVNDTKIGLISRGQDTPYEILFYIPEGDTWEEKDQKTLMESISWFLPLNYQVAWAKQDDPDLHLEAL